MPALPTGTLTFLFTDIEGSTRLWEQYPESMRQAHRRHGELIVKSVEMHGGVFVRTRGEGDSTFSVFPVASEALAAACDFQRTLAAEPWPETTPIRVRAALHSGTAHLVQGDYNSSDVNRCARLRAIAHGGQTLLSETTYHLVKANLPQAVNLKDMGRHRLKDLQEAEHVWQLVHPDLQADFPLLNSLNIAPTNLPRQRTTFIGRQKEMEEIGSLLAETPLLTLTGTGGCGKTRLALQAASEVLESYPDGVWLVELAALSDSTCIPEAFASAFGLQEEAGRALSQTVTHFLQSKTALLVVDNCEHLVEGCSRMVDLLLRSCPHVTILATSREALNIAGETLFRVPPLSLPDPAALPAEEKDMASALLEYDGIRLFIERARKYSPHFTLNRQNGAAVAEACHQLDGIPLAIELAAARVRTMTVEEITGHLEDRFRLLSGGNRTALPRQQTLRALIDWSYDLLTDPERLLLARLSVFAGGWTLEAAEKVCAGIGIEEWQVFDLLVSLVDKSLVVFEDQEGESRYHLLETIRQYGQERLDRNEAALIYQQHRNYYLALAEEAEPQLRGAEQSQWLSRLEREHANMRVALARSQGSEGDTQMALRLAGALGPFWEARGHLTEGRQYLCAILEHPEARERSLSRAKSLIAASILMWRQGDIKSAQPVCEEAISIYREIGDRNGLSAALGNLGAMLQAQGDYTAAWNITSECLSVSRQSGNQRYLAGALNNLGIIAQAQKDYDKAYSLYEESLKVRREIEDKRGIAETLNSLGTVSAIRAKYREAGVFFRECLAIAEELNNKWLIATALINLASTLSRQGDSQTAHALFQEGLSAQCEIGDRYGMAFTLEGLAKTCTDMDRLEKAAVLMGAAARLREIIAAPLAPNSKEEYDLIIDKVQDTLGEEAFLDAWKQGWVMEINQAVEYAVEVG